LISAIPLMIVPFALYNIAMFGIVGLGGPQWLEQEVTSFAMMSGAVWSMSFGDLLIVLALLLLFVEILKATRHGPFQITDHLLSMLVFIAFLVEFLLFDRAATDVFFILMVIAFVDVIAGFSVSIRTARRDVSIGL
jgi:hypothetical protein